MSVSSAAVRNVPYLAPRDAIDSHNLSSKKVCYSLEGQ
jgi:hypothetical protein